MPDQVVASASRAGHWRLDNAPESVGRARRVTRDFLQDGGPLDDPDTIVLLVSELVANAVIHAYDGRPIELALRVGVDRVRIEVSDHNSAVPMLRSPSLEDESGRGLLVVDRASSEWGVRPIAAGGHCVWCDVDARASPPSRAHKNAIREGSL